MRRGTVETNGPSTVPEHHLDVEGGSPSPSLLGKGGLGDGGSGLPSHNISASPLLTSSLSIDNSNGGAYGDNGGQGYTNNYGNNDNGGRPYNSVMNDPNLYFFTSHTASTLRQTSIIISLVSLLLVLIVLPVGLGVICLVFTGCVNGFLFSLYLCNQVLSVDEGTKEMRGVSDPIREGAEGK